MTGNSNNHAAAGQQTVILSGYSRKPVMQKNLEKRDGFLYNIFHAETAEYLQYKSRELRNYGKINGLYY